MDIIVLKQEPDNWVTVPTNSTLTIHNQTVMIHPIIDEFYCENPAHSRSSQFAQTKGQSVANSKKEVVIGGVTSEAVTPRLELPVR